MPFYTHTTEQALNELNVTENGLPISDAEERLAQYGPNAIRVESEPLWRKLIEPFANVFMLVLFIAVVAISAVATVGSPTSEGIAAGGSSFTP